MRYMILALALSVVASAEESRIYHPSTIAGLATSRHTHVRVVGKVTLVRHEADGDIHIRLSDGSKFVVAEIIPKIPLSAPKMNTTIAVEGIRRFDNEAGHGWAEIHPVEKWELVEK